MVSESDLLGASPVELLHTVLLGVLPPMFTTVFDTIASESGGTVGTSTAEYAARSSLLQQRIAGSLPFSNGFFRTRKVRGNLEAQSFMQGLDYR